MKKSALPEKSSDDLAGIVTPIATVIDNDLPLHPEDKKKIEAGRGQGIGPEYRPWFEITDRDCPKKGKRAMIYGYKSGRNHHALSLGEAQLILLAEADPDIEEIFDQWVVPFDETKAVADACGLQHHRSGGCLRAISTDFLFRRTNGEYFGRTFKLSTDLPDPLTLGKLDVERRWYEQKHNETGSGWGWKIVTELDINTQHAENLRDLHAYRDPSKLGIASEDINAIREYCEPMLVKAHSFNQVAESTAHALSLKRPDVVKCFRHFIATGLWAVDLSIRLDMSLPFACRKTKIKKLKGYSYVTRAA
jgi:hypothetical protein